MKKGDITVLTIAGSDPSGNVGIQGDLATFQALGVNGVSAVTVITAQTSDRGLSINPTPADVLSQQIASAMLNNKITAVKVGMIGTNANVRVISWFLSQNKFEWVVVDPILHSSNGAELFESHAIPNLQSKLLTKATLITPNLEEASTLAGMRVFNVETMKTSAKEIFDNMKKLSGGMTPLKGVLVKGGNLKGDAVDILYDGNEHHIFRSPRYISKLTHGAGCVLSAAVTAYLAKGLSLNEAIDQAKTYLVGYFAARQ